MKITASLIDKLLALKSGSSIPASSLRGEWVEELLHDGVLVSRSQGSRRTLLAVRPTALEQSLAAIDERLADLDRIKSMLTSDVSRAEQAAETGNSKLVAVRTCPGFLVNSYTPVNGRLNGSPIVISPMEGSFLYIADWQHFSVPADVVVVGIENMENFRHIRMQRKLFDRELPGSTLLFVSRYPQSADLRRWLASVPNLYVHFGDFDLAGINIFLTEYHQHLGAKSSFLIPSDIESRLLHGSSDRYATQQSRFRHLRASLPELQTLIDMINRYHRCYDQEGYIEPED